MLIYILFTVTIPNPITILFFFFNAPATTEIYPLPLHAALPICALGCDRGAGLLVPPRLCRRHPRPGPRLPARCAGAVSRPVASLPRGVPGASDPEPRIGHEPVSDRGQGDQSNREVRGDQPEYLESGRGVQAQAHGITRR